MTKHCKSFSYSQQLVGRASLIHLRLRLGEALLIAQHNEDEKGDQGDVARVIRRMAEAYIRKGETEDGLKLWQTAETMRKELQGDRYAQLPDTEETYNLLVSYYYR
jgi:hypothetical protein